MNKKIVIESDNEVIALRKSVDYHVTLKLDSHKSEFESSSGIFCLTNGTQWCLELALEDSIIDLELEETSQMKEMIEAKFSFTFKSQNKAIADFRTEEFSFLFSQGNDFVKNDLVFPNDYRNYHTSEDNTVTIVLNITLFDKEENTKVSSTHCWFQTPEFVNHAATSDVHIMVSNDKIAVHKFVLAVHSPVFKAMFENQMEESVNNEILIIDFSEEVVRSLIMCLYDHTAIKGEMEKHAEQLLQIASKYQIQVIIQASEIAISNKINVKTAIDYLKFADAHSSSAVKEKAFNFIIDNYSDVFKTPNIAGVLGVELCNELFAHMVNHGQLTRK